MRRNTHNNRRKTRTAATNPAANAGLPVYTAGQRDTVRHGLRILARIIARAHLRREASRAESVPSPDRGVGG